MDDTIYLDRQINDQVARMDPSGWSLTTCPPVRFLKGNGALSLPMPVKGGNLREVGSFINATEKDVACTVAYMVGAMSSQGPYPILEFTGEQGWRNRQPRRYCAL